MNQFFESFKDSACRYKTRGRFLQNQLRVLSFSILFLSSCLATFAQENVKVTGTITSEQGDVLPGVTVTLKGKELSAISDGEGKFSIDVPNARGVLVFSYVGYANQE